MFRMTIHDLVSGHHSSATDLPELVPPGKESNESRHLVVVDSLSFLLLRYSMEIVCRWLINHTPSLLLVHSDLHEDEILAQLQYIATSVISLDHTHHTRPLHYSALAHVSHQKSSGKVIKQVRRGQHLVGMVNIWWAWSTLIGGLIA